MVMSGSWLMVRRTFTIIRSCRMRFVLMVASLDDDIAKRKVAMIAGYRRLMLDTIDHACHTGAREAERQRDAQHRAKPKGQKSRQYHHHLNA